MSEFYIRGKPYSAGAIDSLTQEGLVIQTIGTMPSSLYKYFSNTIDIETGRNYSQEALENNTVFLAQPSQFDDPYDCTILIDEEEFARQRIAYYAQLCGLKILPEWDYSKVLCEFSCFLCQGLAAGKKLAALFPVPLDGNNVFETQHKLFVLSLQTGLNEFQNSEQGWGQAFYKAIHQEYVGLIKENVESFRVACFTESPYSMLMWAHYANSHKGFCLEYEIPPYGEPYIQLFHSLLPVIYSSKRVSILDQCLRSLQPPGLTEDILWDIFKYGLLMKSLNWKYQNEWRLISCANMLSGDDHFNCNFFKIKKVFLGNKMNPQDRLKIIDICKRKQIAYAGVTIAPNKYEMSDCPQLCEDCPKLAIPDKIKE